MQCERRDREKFKRPEKVIFRRASKEAGRRLVGGSDYFLLVTRRILQDERRVEPSRPEATKRGRGFPRSLVARRSGLKVLTFPARTRTRATAARFAVCAAQFAEPLKKEEEPSTW